MYVLYPPQYVVLAQLMRSSNLLTFLVDLLQHSEMLATFGFGDFCHYGFWNIVCGRTAPVNELPCLRQTISPCKLGGLIIDADFFHEELHTRLDYCKRVWGMNSPIGEREN